jgi:hypothetical protein
MVNKFQKFLIFLSSVLALGFIVLLLKIQADNKKLIKIEQALQDYLDSQKTAQNNTPAVVENKLDSVPVSQPTMTEPANPAPTTATPVPVPAPAPVPVAPSKKTKTS